MKYLKIYTLLALLLMAGGVTAQESDIVFAPLGAEWHYNYFGMFEEGYVNIKATKDTIIDGFNCVELEKNKWFILMILSFTEKKVFMNTISLQSL